MTTPICKKRKDLLREKLTNLCTYLDTQFPEKKLSISKIIDYTDEEVADWIFANIVPYYDDLPGLVDRMGKAEGVVFSKDVKERLVRYSRFMCELFRSSPQS